MGGRFSRAIRHAIVSAVQHVTDMRVMGDRFALWGYETRDAMQARGLSWWLSVDRSYEMDQGTRAQVVVMGESLNIYPRRGMDRQRDAALVAGLRQLAPEADADAARGVVATALRTAAVGAAVAAREAGGSRFWRSRPAGW